MSNRQAYGSPAKQENFLDRALASFRNSGQPIVPLLRDEWDNRSMPAKHRREGAVQVMRQMIEDAEGRTFTASEHAAFDSLKAEIEHLDAHAKLEQAQVDQDAAKVWDGIKQKPSGWRDLRTGRMVNVYSPDQLMARPEGTDTDVSVGDLVCAMVTGHQTEDVRAELGSGTDSTGGYLVPERLSRDLIDRMRAKTRVIQAGARTVEMDTDNLAIAGIAEDPVPAWRSENELIAKSNPSFNRLEFNARWLGVLVKTSRELLEDSANAAEAINTALAGALATEWDRTAMLGSGTAPEPRGVGNTTGVHEIIMADNGAALDGYSQLLQAVSMTAAANAEMPTAAIMAPRTLFQGFSGLTANDGQPLKAPEVLREFPWLHTSGIPVDEEQGTAENASRIILGDFRQLMLGIRSTVRIEVLREVFAERHQFGIVAWLRADVAVAQPTAFAQIKGIIPA